MTSAATILERAEQLGVELVPETGDCLRVRGTEEARRQLRPLLVEHKWEIIVELRRRERRPVVGIVPTASDAVREAARLLREGCWAAESPVCAFHIGNAGETCRRCGALWIEH